MMNEPVSSIMTSNPKSLTPENSLDDVRKIFVKNPIHHLPIVEQGKLVGLVTTYDLWKSGKSFQDYPKIKIRKIMTTRLAKLEPSDKIGTAAEIFFGNNIHALPVVSEKNELIGIITSFDVLKYEFEKAYPNPILFKHKYGKPDKTIPSR